MTVTNLKNYQFSVNHAVYDIDVLQVTNQTEELQYIHINNYQYMVRTYVYLVNDIHYKEGDIATKTSSFLYRSLFRDTKKVNFT